MNMNPFWLETALRQIFPSAQVNFASRAAELATAQIAHGHQRDRENRFKRDHDSP
jgi:hypothetical protein